MLDEPANVHVFQGRIDRLHEREGVRVNILVEDEVLLQIHAHEGHVKDQHRQVRLFEF